MKELYIVGAGSVGGYIATNFNDFKLKGVRLAGFLDDNPAKQGNNFCGVPIIGPVSLLHRKAQVAVIMGIAFPK